MKLIVGLGNPGCEYAKTKHNVGFMLADALAEKLNITSWKEKYNALVADAYIGAEKIIIAKPQTYMNNSGNAVVPLMNWYKLEPEELIVIHDDMDIPAGTIRIRKKGSSGGHNGIKSILTLLGNNNFSRVRIGIGRPLPQWTVINHVLAPFPEEDAPKIKDAINYLVPALECMVKEGTDVAMNKFNPKKQKKKPHSETDQAPDSQEVAKAEEIVQNE